MVDLVARQGETSSRRPQVEGYTLNAPRRGRRSGPGWATWSRCTLVNESVADGVALHWHGVDVPNAEDGVAGVTQDAVPVGGEHVYRFVAPDAGTYWYHSHQVSHEQVPGGLFGALVVDRPATRRSRRRCSMSSRRCTPTTGVRTVNGATGTVPVDAGRAAGPGAGDQHRQRAVARCGSTGAPYRVVAVDGIDLHEPTEVTDAAVVVTAGGRVDLAVTHARRTASAVRVDARWRRRPGRSGPRGGGPATARQPTATLDLLSLRHAGAARASTRRRRPVTSSTTIGRRPGFLDGRPGLLVDDERPPVSRRADVHRARGRHRPDDDHATTAARCTRCTCTGTTRWCCPATGSRPPAVRGGSTRWTSTTARRTTIAFVADNPGIWMDHCHNLPHAGEGMVAHLAYEGVTTPYVIGSDAGNTPE